VSTHFHVKLLYLLLRLTALDSTHHVISDGQQEGYLEERENSLQTLFTAGLSRSVVSNTRLARTFCADRDVFCEVSIN